MDEQEQERKQVAPEGEALELDKETIVDLDVPAGEEIKGGRVCTDEASGCCTDVSNDTYWCSGGCR